MPTWWGTGKTINVGVVPSRMLYIYRYKYRYRYMCVIKKKKKK